MPTASTTVQPKLGLVCITTSTEVRYRTITRTRLLQFDEANQRATLHQLYCDNIQRFRNALDFCITHGIQLYRYTANLFPFADTPLGMEVLLELQAQVQQLGAYATAQQIRLLVHPDQFVVLNSENPQVVLNSLHILTTHATIMDLLQQPRSPWAIIEIHGGKGGRGDALVETIQQLPTSIRQRLALENDESAYSAEQILAVCQATGVPMVFDAHHHICRQRLASYDDPSVQAMLAAARTTWPDPNWQIVHISNGRDHFGDRSHSDLIQTMPSAYADAPWIEVEAKHKELAIAHLREHWLAQLLANSF